MTRFHLEETMELALGSNSKFKLTPGCEWLLEKMDIEKGGRRRNLHTRPFIHPIPPFIEGKRDGMNVRWWFMSPHEHENKRMHICV